MEGEEQTTISPEFLENIQSAVNSQGVLGQVQVIQTENGPVTVLFMEEGADTSNIGSDNITLTVSDGNLVDAGIEDQNSQVQFQYQVQPDEDYTQFLQSGNAEIVSTTETVKDVAASVEPVIGISEQGTVESAQEKGAESNDTYFITDTGEILKIDSSLLGDSGETFQLQTQDGTYQVLNQLGSVQTSSSNDTQARYSQPVIENTNVTFKESAPFEYTATKVEAPLVIDTSRVEEPKVLSYKTTNRQRTNIMRQPVSKPSPVNFQSKPVVTNQNVKTQTSLLSNAHYKTVKQVDPRSKTTEIVYPKSYQKQTLVFPKVQKQAQQGSVIKTDQAGYQPQMITTVVNPQSLLKPGVDQSFSVGQALKKFNTSQIQGSSMTTQSLYAKKPMPEVNKFTSQVVSRQIPAVTKQQTDLLSVAMKQAEVPEQVLSSIPTVPKKILEPVVKDLVPANHLGDKALSEKLQGVKGSLQDIAVAKPLQEITPDPVSFAGAVPVMEKQSSTEQQTVLQPAAEITSGVATVTEKVSPAVENAVSQTDGLDESEMETDAWQQIEDNQPKVDQKAADQMTDKLEVSETGTSQNQNEEATETDVNKETEEANKGSELTKSVEESADTQLASQPGSEMKSIDVPDSDVTIQLFADGTLVTRDKAGTNYSQVKLEDLGLDLSMLEGNTDIELLIVQGDGKEVRATINTSKDVNPTTASVTQPSKTVSSTSVASNVGQGSKETTALTKTQSATAPINEARPYKCSMCPRTFKFYRTFRCHEIVHTKAVTFTCHLCQRLFAREVNLQSHLELHKKKGAMRPTEESRDIKSRQCPHCKKIYGDVSKMQRHVREQHEQKKIPCPICAKLFTSESNVQRHARIHVGPFTCPHCVKVFVEKSEYCEHIKSEHADLMFQCKECDAVLPSKKAFMNHTLTQHSNAEMLLEGMKVKECPVCDKKFEKMSALERHMFVHSSEKSHECPACRKKYKFLPRLEQHIKEEHNNEVVFTCSECEEQFIFKGKLDLHVKLFHSGNYRCLTCYEVFPERLLLEEHQFKNHDISFECSKCKEKFETSLKLKHHLTEHTSQNNLCDICGAGFEHKAQLRTHLTDQHFGRDKSSMLKQYPGMAKVSVEILCDLCGEFWPSKPMYKQHLRDVHFGGDTVVMLQYFPYMEKISDPPEPATCDHCGKVCASITQLNFHLRSHMKTKERGKQKEELSSDDEQDDDVDLTNIEPREMDKDYRCSLCGAEFSRKAALEKHKAVHKKDEFKEALRELEKEEIARAELEEKEGFKPAPKAKKIGIVSSKTKPKVLKSLNKKSGKVKLPFPKTTGKKDSDTAEAEVGQKKRKQMHICRVCEEIFTTSQELTLHMQDDHGDVDFMAESEPENDHNTTVESSSMVKFDLSTFQCISCNKDFSCRKYLRKHLNRVHNYKQNLSAESPNSAGTQSVATSDIHESLKDSKSSGKNSSKKNEKKRKKEIDEDFEPVEEGFDDNADDSTADITAFLGKNFNLGKAHSCNIESVKKKQHRCSLCGERFSREATLKKHIALHESSEDLNMKPEFEDLMDFQPAIYPCTSCGNMYSTALGLIHHTRSKHSEVDEETVLAQIAEVDERLKLESPKKKMDSKASKSVKRKLDSDVEEFGDTTRKRMKLDKDSKESFECSLCGAVYCTFKGLKRHQQDIHSEEKVESQHSPVKYSHSGRLITKSKKLIEQIQCDKCSKTFLEARNLKLHVLRVHKADEFDKAQLIDNTASPDIGFKCDHCPKEFGRRINLRRHMKMKHNLELPPDSAETSSYESLSKGKHAGYHCNICEKKFTTSTGLHQHLVSFHDESDGNLVSVKAEPITCQICEQEFATKKTLEVHMRKHTGEKPYKCCLCNKQFISKYQLECHMKKLHTTLFAKKIKCKICLMLFETEKAMLKHKVVHKKLARDEDSDDNDEKDEDESGQHKCDQCSKSFRWKKNLMSHLETYHKNSDPQTCGVCNKVFPDMASVKAHMAEHQSTAVSYTCKICDKSFPKEVSLKMHESHMHKPKSSPSGMSCDVCKESFQTKMKLLEHMLTHTSMMPYKCDLCSASFKQEFRLKAHKLTHKIKNKKTEMTDTKKSKAPVTKGKESEKSHEVKEVTPKKFKCKKCTKQFNKLWLLRSHMSKSHKSKLPVNVAFMKNRATTRSRSSSETKTAPDKEEAPVKEKTKLKEKKNVSKDLKKGSKSTSFCKKCNLNFITTETYMKHLKTVHEKSKKGENSKQTELKKSEKKVLLKSGTKTGKAKKEEKSTSKKSGKKEMIGHDCPVCKKMFSKQFRLKNHIKNVHKLEVDETPSPTGIKRTKCLYCTDCARVFWSQVKYDIHNKRFHPDKSALELDKQVMQAMSGEIKTEPDDGFSSPKQSDFETVQHKCEFCSKVHWTKKLFDEHMLKEHPEHAHEYGISGGEDTFKPSIELVNDSEDMMGNMLSVGLFDVSECDKLSSLPVVSIQRMNGNLNNLMAGNAQQEDLEADIEMEERDVNEEVGGDGSIDRNKEVVDNETETDQETFDMAGKTDSSSDVGCVISSVKTLQEMETGDTEEEESTVITDEQNVTDRHLENVNIVESALVSEEPNTSENLAGESRDESDKGENQYSREFEKFLQSSEVELDQHKEVEKPSEEDKDSKDDSQNVQSDEDLEVNTAGNNSSEVEQNKDSKVNPLSERVETCEEEFSQESAENETTEADGSEGIEEQQEVVRKSFRPRNGSEIDNENMEESDIEKEQEGIDWEAIDSEIEAAVEENYRESKEEEIGETSDVPDKVEDGRKENKTVVESDNANIVREEVSHGEGKQVEDEQTNHLEVYASAGNSDLDSNFTVTLNTEDDISDNSDAVDNGKQQESMADLKVIDESQAGMEEMDVS